MDSKGTWEVSFGGHCKGRKATPILLSKTFEDSVREKHQRHHVDYNIRSIPASFKEVWRKKKHNDDSNRKLSFIAIRPLLLNFYRAVTTVRDLGVLEDVRYINLKYQPRDIEDIQRLIVNVTGVVELEFDIEMDAQAVQLLMRAIVNTNVWRLNILPPATKFPSPQQYKHYADYVHDSLI